MSKYQTLFGEFHLPDQDAKKLSFCGTKPRQLQSWLDDLATTQVKQVSIVLYKLLPEVNHLAITGSQRLGLMSILRPYVHHCISGLAEDFLKQPLSLTENMTKIAAIAQALQRHLCDGYMITIRQILQADKLSSTASYELSLALYYATHGLSQLLYRSYQLYVPRPPMLWSKLHQLYKIAEEQKLNRNVIPDELLESSQGLSNQQAYLRAVLLSCSHNNQLRQVDIQYLYMALEKWSPMVSLQPAKNIDKHIYWLDSGSDEGPFYQSRYKADSNEVPNNGLYALNLNTLTELLSSTNTNNDAVSDIPIHLRQSLIAHLKTCWKQEHSRSQPRQQSKLDLEICIGLKAAHQQLLGDTTFDDFLKQKSKTLDSGIIVDGSPMDISENGTFTNRISAVGNANYDSQPRQGDFAIVTATDISEQGYCLRWSGPVPPQIKSGEIILLKKPNTEHWQAGAIRWAQRLNKHTYIGVQILEGYAKASAASTTLQNGDATPFFRTVLLINENTTNDVAASGHLKNGEGKTVDSAEISSLITPTIPFAPQQKIQLQTEDDYQEAKLHDLLLSSGSISQYSYQSL
ncbi:MAG: hypothetical protein ACRBBR_08545 [Cellvibrionaceae bacterium]